MAGADISVVERIELRPQDAAFEFERGQDGLLLLGRVCFAFYVIEREIGIARRLGEAGVEIGQRLAADEIVARQHAGDALADDGRREHLGERRGDRLEQAAFGDEADIGLDGKARRRQGARHGGDIGAIEAETVGQGKPAGDAATTRRVAGVIDEALAPDAAQLAVAGPRDERGILAWDGALIAIAVERPGLHLPLVQPAAMQQPVKRVQVVVALGADATQRGIEPVGSENLGHRVNSSPSCATVQPAANAAACSGESSSSAGLVLLIWMKILRSTARSRKAAIAPLSPAMLICPMRCPVLAPTPRRIISSSRHSVPSKNTSGAPRRRCANDGVIAAQPGMKKKRAPVAGSAISRPMVRPSSWMPGSRPGSSSQSATFPGTAKAVIRNSAASAPAPASASGFSRRRTRRSTQSGASTRKIEFSASTACTSDVAHSTKEWRSRMVRSPATASTSPPVRATPAIGEERSPCRGQSRLLAS